MTAAFVRLQRLAQQLPVIVVSPLRVRRYAGAPGLLAKTDELDARLIARFAAELGRQLDRAVHSRLLDGTSNHPLLPWITVVQRTVVRPNR